jgi:enamine deaminase RidA (YjgF/YER057c/UK114 family)
MGILKPLLALILLLSLASETLDAQRRRKKKGEEEEITQTLEVPKDPPATITADPQRLGFLTAALSSKGLLSQQVRDSLKAIRSQARGAAVVKIRALVAGTGDLRRVPAIVSETFTEWKLALPAVTVVRVGALPQEGAQVLVEAVTVERKAVNPNGLAFLAGQQVTSKEPTERAAPLVAQSAANLQTALKGIATPPENVLRVTCFASALSDYLPMRQQLAVQFPKAALAIVQVLRGLSTGLAECEAVARLRTAPGRPLEMVNPTGLPVSPNYSQVALVNAPKVIISGSQLAFHNQDSDIKLAFERLGRAMEQGGGSLYNAIMTNYYPLSQSTIDKIRQIRFEFLDKSKPPASTMLMFEGLPSMDASFAMEVIALP